jgi:hypothetical protein
MWQVHANPRCRHKPRVDYISTLNFNLEYHALNSPSRHPRRFFKEHTKSVSQLPSFSAMVSIIFDDEMFNNNTIFSSGQEVKVQLLGL